jgi:hypothetical protein
VEAAKQITLSSAALTMIIGQPPSPSESLLNLVRVIPALSKSVRATYIGSAGREIGYGDKRLSE